MPDLACDRCSDDLQPSKANFNFGGKRGLRVRLVIAHSDQRWFQANRHP